MARSKKAIPQHIRREVVNRDNGICRYCGKPGEVKWFGNSWFWMEHEFDHIIPESKNGMATVDNIVIACRKCNRSKGNKSLRDKGMVLLKVGESIG